MSWRGCAFDGGFLNCMLQFNPLSFWISVFLLWLAGLAIFMLWTSRRT